MINLDFLFDIIYLNSLKQADEVSVSNYVKNEDWSLIKAPCERNEIIYDCCPEPYQGMKNKQIFRFGPRQISTVY